ncbi:MAG: hypothetical protein SGJ20_07170 [Planctomycetota bacterium]|nr:hypothetical protein [Planctomycetota bacterium]
MTLLERAHSAQKALFSRYDRLNQLWTEAEKRLTSNHVPHFVTVVCQRWPDIQGEETIEEIGLVKIKGEWRIGFTEVDGRDTDYLHVSWIPIVDCSAQIRVNCAKHLPKLEQAVVESAEKFIPRVDIAIDELTKFLA